MKRRALSPRFLPASPHGTPTARALWNNGAHLSCLPRTLPSALHVQNGGEEGGGGDSGPSHSPLFPTVHSARAAAEMTQHRQNRHVTRDHGTQRHGEPGITRGPNARTRKWPREEPHGAVEPRDARTGVSLSR